MLIFPDRSYYQDDCMFLMNETMSLVASYYLEGLPDSEILKRLKKYYTEVPEARLRDDILASISDLKSIVRNLKIKSKPTNSLFNVNKELEKIHNAVWSNGYPFYVGIEPTWECNFRCQHCFVLKENKKHIKIDQWKFILNELSENGCLYLTITGGEPLLFPEFEELYLYAKKKGFVVTVYTNGSLIKQSTYELFHKYPPKQLDISLYGASIDSYAKVTNNPKSFDNVSQGIQLLSSLKNKTRILLKAVILKDNKHEINKMREFAKKFQLPLSTNCIIRPRMDGDLENTLCRLTASEAVNLEMKIASNFEAWNAYLKGKSMSSSDSDEVECSAGDVALQIDSEGNAGFCVLHREPSLNVLEKGLERTWKNMKAIRSKYFKKPQECKQCNYSHCCDFCPAWGVLESGNQENTISYVCEISQERYNHLINHERRYCNEKIGQSKPCQGI